MFKNLDDTTKLFLIGIVFLLMILFILFTSIKEHKEKDYSFISKSLDSFGEKYALDINFNNKKIVYSTDKKFKVYESEDFENKRYVKYDGKTYTFIDDKLNEIESNNDLVSSHYYDIDFIKKIINYCDFSTYYEGMVSCIIKADDYNKEVLSSYGLGRTDNNDVKMFFYSKDNNINRISINYGNDNCEIEINENMIIDYSNLVNLIN